jgi:hypothetical protein
MECQKPLGWLYLPTGQPVNLRRLRSKWAIEKRSPEYTIDLGDTYYAGFKDEISHNLLACWPCGIKYEKCFAMNGNHEMYCGGKPYFDYIPILGQSASYFNLGKGAALLRLKLQHDFSIG